MGSFISSLTGKLRTISVSNKKQRKGARLERRRLTCEPLEQRLPLTIGIAGWWKAESNVVDSIGGNNGTSTPPAYAAGIVGNAFSFGANSSAVRIQPSNTNLDFGGDLTIEAWVYLSAANSNNGLVYRGDFAGSHGDFAFGFLSGVANQLVFRVNLQNFGGNTNGNGQVVTQNANGTAFTLTTGTWHHVAAVYDAIDNAVDTMTIYVNGVARGSSTYNGNRGIRNSNPLVLGAYRSASYQLNGLLDEVSIYDTALLHSNIQNIYNVGSGGKSNMLTFPGSYSATGFFPGTLASLGNYVNSAGATSQTAASLGHYVDKVGATAQTPAPLGRYVSITGATATTITPPGTYVNTTAATVGTPSHPGYYIPRAGATSSSFQIAAPLGRYALAGSSTAILAPAGSYVGTIAASAPTPAQPGYFVSTSGASSQTPAAVGTYVPNTGATVVTVASVGFYVPTTAATRQTPAAAGFYVPTTGASAVRPAAPGYYVPSTGASSQIPASPGYYVATSGATEQTLCPVGTTSGHAATSCQASFGSMTLPTDGTASDLPQRENLENALLEIFLVYADNEIAEPIGLELLGLTSAELQNLPPANSNSIMGIANHIEIEYDTKLKKWRSFLFKGMNETKRIFRETLGQGTARDLAD